MNWYSADEERRKKQIGGSTPKSVVESLREQNIRLQNQIAESESEQSKVSIANQMPITEGRIKTAQGGAENVRREMDLADISALDKYYDTYQQTASDMSSQRARDLQEREFYANQNMARENEITNKYVQEAGRLADESRQQASDASRVYKGTIQPEMRSSLEDAKVYQQGVDQQAMTLAQMQDPNNIVQQGYRDLYNKQGQAGFEQFQQDIAGTRQQGLADFGVLSNLGAQAAGQQMAGMPVTGGQMAAIMAQQGRQASEAYAGVQQRMRGLQDQARAYQLGMQGQGLEAGRQESGQAYERGRAAKESAMDRTASRIADIMRAEGDFVAQQQGLRGEQGGLQGNITNEKRLGSSISRALQDELQGRKESRNAAEFNQILKSAGLGLDISREKTQLGGASSQRREAAEIESALRALDSASAIQGIQTQLAAAKAQQDAAEKTARAQERAGLYTGIASIGSTALGAIMSAGNPAAAGAAGAVGGTIANQIFAPKQYTAPNYTPTAMTNFSGAPVSNQMYNSGGYGLYGGYDPSQRYNLGY